jgi:hypothetical protein
LHDPLRAFNCPLIDASCEPDLMARLSYTEARARPSASALHDGEALRHLGA